MSGTRSDSYVGVPGTGGEKALKEDRGCDVVERYVWICAAREEIWEARESREGLLVLVFIVGLWV